MDYHHPTQHSYRTPTSTIAELLRVATFINHIPSGHCEIAIANEYCSTARLDQQQIIDL